MAYLFAFLLLIVAVIFGLSSISQSYASAKQAQAVIEASRAAQIASAGNLVSLVSVILVIVTVLAAVVVIVIAWFILRVKSQPRHRWMAGWNDNREEVSSSQVTAMLPVLFSMMMYQVIQSQQEQHQQQTEQLWMMNEAAHDMDVATFSDNSTWDF